MKVVLKSSSSQPAGRGGLRRDGRSPQGMCGQGFLGWLFSFLASPEREPEVLGCPSAEGRREEWVCRVLGPEGQACWGVG